MAGAPDSIRFRREAAAAGWLALASLLLASCGGGAGGGNTGDPQVGRSPPPIQSASFVYPAPPAYVVRTAIAPLAPVVSDLHLSGFISAGLPVGLVLNPTNGVISGTPIVVSPSVDYWITATTSTGQIFTTDVNLTVDAVGPGAISYGASAFTFTTGIPASTLTPQVNGAVTGWSIAPQLPAGLAFDSVSGSISGTPTAASPRTAYTVTAQASAGTLSVTFAIEVDTDVLVDLGHNAPISSVQFSGSSVLSEDGDGRWVLWNYGTGAMIASGDAGPPGSARYRSALAGAVAVIQTRSGLEVWSASTGELTAHISPSPYTWSLAADGSYIVGGDETGLSVWSPAGQLLISRPGNYAPAIMYAAPGAIRMGNGPGGAQVIETVSVPSGADAISEVFQGQFASWFLDGSGFLSTVSGTVSGTATKSVLAYSNAIVQEASLTNPPTNWGQPYALGTWLWTVAPGTISVYTLAAPQTPVATYAFSDGSTAMASASTIGVWDPASGTLSVIDLSGTAPVKIDYASPFGISDQFSTYAATSASEWISGSAKGVLLDGASLPGTPRFLDYGEAYSVAGNANRVVIATASGRILYFNAATLAQEGTIPLTAWLLTDAQYQSLGQETNPEVALSSDGTILAVMEPGGFPVNIYSLPSGSLLYSWLYAPSDGLYPEGISLSASGTILGVTSQFPSLGRFAQTVSAATGGVPIFSSTPLSQDGWAPVLRISPDGTQIATSPSGNPDVPPVVGFKTSIVKSGAAVPFVLGWPVGWIDDTHLLANSYVPSEASGGSGIYTGCAVYDLSGNATGNCALPEVLGFQNAGPDTLYVLNQPAMVSVSTGTVSWMSGDASALTGWGGPSFGNALAGSHVVLVSDSRLAAQSY